MKVQGLGNGKIKITTEGLSDAEKEAFEKMMTGGGGSRRFEVEPDTEPKKPEEEQTVSIVKFNETKEEYKTKIAKLEEKIEGLKRTVSELRTEKEQAESRAEKLRQENEELKGQIENKRGSSAQDAEEISKLRGEISRLQKAMKTIEEDAQKDLKLDLADARTKNESLKATNEALLQKISDLEENISELKADKDELSLKLEEALNAPQRIRLDEPETAGTIRREGPTVFSSSLFTVPRYDVKLAKSGKYITFEPDVKGLITCDDNRLDIPSLDTYIGYQGSKDHTAIRKGNKLVIYL